MKKTITILLLICIVVTASAQKQVKYYLPHINVNKERANIPTNSSQYYLNAIDSVIYDTPSYLSAFAKNRFSAKQSKSDKYAVKGDRFLFYEEYPASTIEYFYYENGKPSMTILKGLASLAYDSSVYVYFPDSRDFEYYGYMKNTNGGYDNKYKRDYIISSPEDNGSDSVYFCDSDYRWNESLNRWDNRVKLQLDYFSADYFSRYSFGAWYSNDGTDWIGESGFKICNIEYNDEGYIGKICFAGNCMTCDSLRYEYEYNSDGSYYELIIYDCFGGNWELIAKFTNIEWKEYCGFTHSPINTDLIASYPEVDYSPFSHRMNKPTSFEVYWYVGDEWQFRFISRSNWDIGEPGSFSMTSYYLVDGIEYLGTSDSTFFNEYGDFYKSTNTGYSFPDENGQQVINLRGTSELMLRTYEEGYGQSGYRHLYVNYDDFGNPDTTFIDGEQITEFSTTPNIWLPIEEYTPTNNTTLNLYPNPATNQVTIAGITAGDIIMVSDISGRQVMQVRATAEEQTIDISTLRAGVYVVKTNQSGNMKFVVR